MYWVGYLKQKKMNTMKIVKNKEEQNAQFAWMKQLQHSEFLLQHLHDTKQSLEICQNAPSTQSQQQDLSVNFQYLNDHPLIRLQTQRLLQQTLNESEQFNAFKALWSQDIQLSQHSWQHFLPQQKPPYIANADVRRYQQYLNQVMFILCSTAQNLNQIPIFMPHLVQWLNGIQHAYTTSKVTLRVEPNVKSEILFELPKHAQVEVCAAPSPYWKKIRINQENQELFGFVMSAYLKF